MSVVIYTKENCPNCELTKRDFDILGIDYEIKDLFQEKELLDIFISRGYRSAPIIVAGENIWAGYNRDEIINLSKKFQ